MTREEALKIWLPVIKMGVESMQECSEALDMAIEALQQEPCTDAISRANTIAEVSHIMLDHPLDGYEDEQLILKTIQDMPPVTPAEKTGQWISNAEDDLKISEYTCSNCKGLSDEDSDFCPKCGSYNGGVK